MVPYQTFEPVSRLKGLLNEEVAAQNRTTSEAYVTDRAMKLLLTADLFPVFPLVSGSLQK